MENGKKLASTKRKSNMKLVTLHLTSNQIEKLSQLVNKKLYPNKAEAIRFAVNDLIKYHDSHP